VNAVDKAMATFSPRTANSASTLIEYLGGSAAHGGGGSGI
jgi:hypothetical protein